MLMAPEYNPFTAGQALWTEYEAYINKVVRGVARSFYIVDEDDLLQEVWIFLWQKEQYFLEGGYSEAYIKTSIRNVIYNYALKERNRILVQTDKFYYHIEEVKVLLPTYFSTPDAWANSPVPEGAATITKNDNVEIFCDFQMAWDRLGDNYKDVLRRRYAEDEDFTDVKERKQLSRATQRFVTLLNQNKNEEARNHKGPGSRRAISNANGLHLAREVDN